MLKWHLEVFRSVGLPQARLRTSKSTKSSLITIVEGAPDKTSSYSAKDLGTLDVAFRRVVKNSYTRPQLTCSKNAIGGEVSEKALKGRAITNRIT
jgi:hypothetical protein